MHTCTDCGANAYLLGYCKPCLDAHTHEWLGEAGRAWVARGPKYPTLAEQAASAYKARKRQRRVPASN